MSAAGAPLSLGYSPCPNDTYIFCALVHGKLGDEAPAFREVLEDIEITEPGLPVIANVSGLPHGGPDDIRQAMVKQITASVQWLSCIQWFMNDGITEYVECGPGKVLSGLIKRIDREAGLHNIQDSSSLEKTAEALR